MTEEALDYHKKTYSYDWLDIEQARVQERERCARLCDDWSDDSLAVELAKQIRSLK